MRYFRNLAAVAGLAVVAATTSAVAASAAPVPTTAHAVTHVANRPDSGNGGTWAYDTLNRTLDVVVSPVQFAADTAAGLTDYTATVSDLGVFSARQGELSPNQSTAGVKIAHAVKGSMTGSISYTITAPAADTLTGVVPTQENDNFAAALVSTANWPKQAFATPAGVTVTEVNTWSWAYQTACEKWLDSAVNGYGNQAADGNVTGQLCVSNLPFVYAGHVVPPQTTGKATVGWLDSAKGWPDSANQCVVIRETGFGFSDNHWGFTCNHGDQAANLGYLWGLTKGQSYALTIVPAASGSTYAHHAPLTGANLKAHVYVLAV